MSKAEERALEAYPPKFTEQKRYSKRIRSEKTDVHQPVRTVYIKGYHQAEKDIRFDLIHKMQECKEKIESGFSNDIEIDIQDFKTEKNFELTWEDIKIILDIENDILRECNSHKELVIETYPKGEDYYGEILKRFREMKEVKGKG